MDSLDEGQRETVSREGIPFLVFEHEGRRVGVAVDQVEVLIGLPHPLPAGQPDVFEYQGEVVPVHALTAWVGLGDSERPALRALIARAGDDVRAFLVDMPRSIVTLPLEAVHRLPVLVQRAVGASPVWGVGHDPQNDELILLVDLCANVVRGADRLVGEREGN